METNVNSNAGRTAIKIGLVAVISLLLLIPLAMIKEVIEDREETKYAVTQEVANSYAQQQVVRTPQIESMVEVQPETDSTILKLEARHKACAEVEYKVSVTPEVLHRSIYDVIVYDSEINIKGSFQVTQNMVKATSNEFKMEITDFKGLANLPVLHVGDSAYEMKKSVDKLTARIEIPKGAKIGDYLYFATVINLKGTESLSFRPLAERVTVEMTSSYAHPSFQGAFLPEYREVSADGFTAKWNVHELNLINIHETMGVKFVEPANPYQQSMRSAKYGMLIIVLVFVAGLFVEFLTRRAINPVQYAVIGLSLVLFYSLLVAFSEFIAFGVAYIIAALMTTGALMLYFRAILKNGSAYLLGGFVALVYVANYMLLRMETYALLAGSLLFFLLLCGIMYLTADVNNNKEISKTE